MAEENDDLYELFGRTKLREAHRDVRALVGNDRANDLDVWATSLAQSHALPAQWALVSFAWVFPHAKDIHDACAIVEQTRTAYWWSILLGERPIPYAWLLEEYGSLPERGPLPKAFGDTFVFRQAVLGASVYNLSSVLFEVVENAVLSITGKLRRSKTDAT